jgi:transposase
MDIREVLLHLRAGASDSRIQRELAIDRRTVKKYRVWAEAQGLLAGSLPTFDELQRLVKRTLNAPLPPQNVSSVTAYAELVRQLRQEGVEVAALWQRLQERGFRGSYAAVWRFVQRLEPGTPDVTVRVESRPGEEAQVDFGYAGLLWDAETGKLRKAWAFVMTLSWSRPQYVEFVFDQKVESWLRLHRNAFEFFGGVPRRVVVDNLKAGITQASWDDPQVQQAYRECAEHYGFRIAPCRPRTPQHKGKVEQGGVHYVKRNFLAGRKPTTLVQANRDAQTWCLTTAGQRIHGTTKEQPLKRFEAKEQAALQPLPATPYDLAVWKVVKLHRDSHITFDHAYYSAPFRLVGQPLRVRGGTTTVRIYSLDYQLVATHERATQPGQRQTHLDHLPPEKVPGLTWNREYCQSLAAEIGPATAETVQRLLNDPVVERLPTVRRLLKLREHFGDERLEAACARALRFEDGTYQTVKRILQQGLEQTLPMPVVTNPPAFTFVRSAAELVGHLFGGGAWS